MNLNIIISVFIVCIFLLFSSGVIWETKKLSGSRYKPMTPKECELIETAFIRYTRKLAIGENEPNVLIKDLNIEVFLIDFICSLVKQNLDHLYCIR